MTSPEDATNPDTPPAGGAAGGAASPGTEDRSARTRKIAWTVLGGTLVAGLVLGTVLALGSDGGTPNQTPAATGTIDPTPEPSPTETTEPTNPETDLRVEDIEIPAGLSSQELGQLVADRYLQWDMASANNRSIYDRVMEVKRSNNTSIDEAAMIIASENADIFTEALFIQDWRRDPLLARNAEFQTERNAKAIASVVGTIARVETLFRVVINVTEIREINVDAETNTRTLEIDFVHTDNYQTLRENLTQTVTLQEVDGKERIVANIVITNINADY